MQIRVTTFTAKGPKDAAATEYEAKPFNFYVFPPPNVRRDIVLSASSTHFLKGNNMDFQQWISKGVPFVDREKEVGPPRASHGCHRGRAHVPGGV